MESGKRRSIMKIVQIGTAGHAFYAYAAIRAKGHDFAALSCGSAGLEAEKTAGALAGLQKRGFGPKLYGDWREMLDAEKPDLAIVNPWFNECADVSIEALKRGIHVFSEKPVAADLASLEALEKAIGGSGAKFAAMFGTRNEPAFLAVKKAVEDGKIGKIRLMDSRKSYKLGKRPAFYGSRETYCGILPWVAIHAVDWMQWLSGEIYTEVAARHSALENGDNGDMDITAAALFGMTNGVIATVTADMYRPASAAAHGDDRVRLVGTKGILEITDGAAFLLSDEAGGKTELPLPPAEDIFADFLNVIEGGESTLGMSAASAVEVTRWSLLARDAAEKDAGGFAR